MSKRQEWESLGESGQYKLVLAIVIKVSKRYGYKIDALDYVGETWLKTEELLDGTEQDLRLTVWSAALSAINREAYQLRKYAAADNAPVRGGDGDQISSLLDLVSGGGSVEDEAILRADFAAFYNGLDEKNREIVSRRITGGETQESIAAKIGTSYSAVWKRLHRMRSQVAEFVH